MALETLDRKKILASSVSREFTPRTISIIIVSIFGFYLGPTGVILGTFAAFMQPMAHDLQWNSTAMSSLITILAISMAATSPLKGLAFDRWSMRPLVIWMSLSLPPITAALSLVKGDSILIYVLFGALGALAPGGLPYGKLIAHWFNRRRGMAYGLYGLGVAIAMPGGLQLARFSVDTLGWRTTFLVYAGLQFFIAIPLLVALFYDKHSPQLNQKEKDAAQPSTIEGLLATQAWSSLDYWLLIIVISLSLFVFSGLSIQGVAILTEMHFTRAQATNAVSTLAIGALLAQPLLGYLMDRIHSPKVAIPFGLAALGGLLTVQVSHAPWQAILGFIILGLGVGGESGTTAYFVTRLFGLRRFSIIYGSIQPFTMALGIALGAFIIGKSHDHTGSYSMTLLMMDAALIIATALLFLIGPYRFSASSRSVKKPVSQ